MAPRFSRSLSSGLLIFGLGACSTDAPPEAAVTAEDVVLAYVDDGLSREVADCFVGLGIREFDAAELLPAATGVGDDLLADDLFLDEMLRSCVDAVSVLEAEDLAPRTSFDTGPFNVGDDAALDALWTKCDRGDGAACDELWRQAPVGSAYESFGVTCGNRPEVLDCTLELNGPDRTPDGAS